MACLEVPFWHFSENGLSKIYDLPWHHEVKLIDVWSSLTALAYYDKRSLFEFLDVSDDSAKPGAHIPRESILSRKTKIILPCIA